MTPGGLAENTTGRPLDGRCGKSDGRGNAPVAQRRKVIV
jgi:hypothetical protein